MFDFENKPIKDWTLEECKIYCNYKYNEKCYNAINEIDLKLYCKLANCDVCCGEPRIYKLTKVPKFLPDEIASIRLIKKTYPWANYIVRTSISLHITELKPRFNDDHIETGTTGLYTLPFDDFFPQIKPLTYYAIDDIIKQGENNNA